MDKTKQELLEIYKIHAELADRVSQRREGANRLYVSLLSVILALLAALLRYGTGIIPVWAVLGVAGVLGMLLAASWFVIIQSYRQLNKGKFVTLHELEEKLAFPFFKREWKLLGEGKDKSLYRKLTIVESRLPIGFFLLFLFLFLISIAIFIK